ncbi:methyltransferase domain-containing protein [Orrella marina]|uniref:Class I SAM-dependent methyltransferase n=1 Tax=Orrella marina TaxID=2163011 RepID=A0A2R4XK48_9BURK|nr:class I SAM-dependent methyltransferase [Orrella marina]AWB34134.1 class I SAM-dependent methyltransferase [Orrella marina]
MRRSTEMMCDRRTPIAGLLVSVFLVGGCSTTGPDGEYRPLRAQHGKDVMWVPTPDKLVDNMLEMAQVGPDDLVYDLGAGDGKIAIEAARKFGATAVGIEYNPDMAEFARQKVRAAGVEDKVTIVTGDIFEAIFSKADVLTLYLLERLNIQLKPQILAMKPGTRVVSNTFRMGAWQPDDTTSVEDGWSAYLWIVPAKVEGKWQFSGVPGMPDGVLDIRQSFQNVTGTYTPSSGTALPVQGRLDGATLALEPQTGFADGMGRSVQFVVDGQQWRFPGSERAIVARKVP